MSRAIQPVACFGQSAAAAAITEARRAHSVEIQGERQILGWILLDGDIELLSRLNKLDPTELMEPLSGVLLAALRHLHDLGEPLHETPILKLVKRVPSARSRIALQLHLCDCMETAGLEPPALRTPQSN